MRLFHKRWAVCFYLVCLALVAASGWPCFAQVDRGAVMGSIVDETGNTVGSARVTLLQVSSGLQRETSAGMDGSFSFRVVRPGRYVLTVEKEGFCVSEVQDVDVATNREVRLRVVLRVGSQSIIVRVSDTEEQIRSQSAFPNEQIPGEVLRNAPVSRADITGLALLLPGVIPEDGERTTELRLHITGSRSDSITFLLDGGLDNNLLDNRMAYMPQLDAIEQVRVLVANYPTEYGRNSGGIVSMTTRSGTPEWHGSAFDFLKNNWLNANSFFNKSDPLNLLPREVLRQNQFGGTLGGPLQIRSRPRGQQKAFFFVAYQGTKLAKTSTIHDVATYTQAQVDGDFSQAVGGGPDPGVAAFLQANPYFQSDPAKAALAIIDPSRISPVALQYFKTGLIPVSSTGLVTSTGRKSVTANDLSTKIDWNPTETDRVSITLGLHKVEVDDPFLFANVNGFPVRDRLTEGYGRVSYVKILSARAANEFALTESRNLHALGEPLWQLPTPDALGIHISADNPAGPPNVIFSSGLSVGFPENGPSTFSSNTFGASDTLSLERGRQHWTIGGGVSDFRNNTRMSQLVNGEFASYGTYTLNDLADFLLGIPSAYLQGPNSPSNVRSRFNDLFVEDEWSVKANLRLTFGLRYEYSTPKADTQNRFFSILPGERSVIFPNAPVGMVFRGDPGVPHGVNFPDRNNFAPRLAFAWSPDKKQHTTVRGAFGLFYDILKAEDNLQFNGQSPFFSNAGLFYSFPPAPGSPFIDGLSRPYEAAGARDPFPSKDLKHNVDFLSEGFLPIGGNRDVYVVDPHLRTPMTHQYSLSVERELGGGNLLEVSYVGSRSFGLTALTDINPMTLGTYDRVLNLTPGNFTCGVNAPQNTCSFAVVREFKNLGWASYNSGSVRWQHRASRSERWGDTYLNVSYTFSHSVDNASGFISRNSTVPYYDHDRFAASSDFDVRQRLVVNGGWTLPLPRYLSWAPKKLTQGWNLYPIVTWRTGFPLDIFADLPGIYDYTSPGPSGAGDADLVRANLVGPIRIQNPRQNQTIQGIQGNYWFDPTSFSNLQCYGYLTNLASVCQGIPGVFPSDAQVVADPSIRTYGNLPRNYVRGPGRSNVDMAISKTTPLNERLILELRGEFFNLFNHAEFLSPNTNINDFNFGQVQNTADPRVIQLGLRLRF